MCLREYICVSRQFHSISANRNETTFHYWQPTEKSIVTNTRGAFDSLPFSHIAIAVARAARN